MKHLFYFLSLTFLFSNLAFSGDEAITCKYFPCSKTILCKEKCNSSWRTCISEADKKNIKKDKCHKQLKQCYAKCNGKKS